MKIRERWVDEEQGMNKENVLVHEKVFPVAWGDMDALGHVNNARYFDYFQEARMDWLCQLNISMTESTGPVVVQVACTFLKPVVYPATLTLRSWVESVGRASMLILHDLYQDEVLMAQGSCKVVWVDYKKQKTISLPEVMRSFGAKETD